MRDAEASAVSGGILHPRCINTVAFANFPQPTPTNPSPFMVTSAPSSKPASRLPSRSGTPSIKEMVGRSTAPMHLHLPRILSVATVAHQVHEVMKHFRHEKESEAHQVSSLSPPFGIHLRHLPDLPPTSRASAQGHYSPDCQPRQ